MVASEGEDARVPVTILTGFLGSGKTTLLNHLLTAQHGKKLAVIENEFGEIGIDDELINTVVQSEENVIEMMNGCICCTVRLDLIQVLGKLAKKVKSASATVPRGRSIACSTPEALAWKEEWMNSAGDISGRAVNVHASSDGFGMDDRAMDDLTVFANGNGAGASASQKKSVAAASALPEATQQQRRQRRQQAPRTPPTARRGAPKPRAAMNGAGRVASRHLRTSTIRLH